MNHESCGFSKVPNRTVVKDGIFAATWTDGGDTERTFGGDLGDDGSFDEWGRWMAYGYNAVASARKAYFTETLSSAEFAGGFS